MSVTILLLSKPYQPIMLVISLCKKIVGKVNGYQISIASSSETKVIYFTGDTIFYSNLTKSVPKKYRCYFFANLGAVKSDSFGGPFTMDLKMLNQMNDLQPKKYLSNSY